MKKEVHGISKNDVQWLLEYNQVCLVNHQNSTRALIQSIIVTELLGRLQADLINMRNKLNSEFVYILHLNDHFSNFNKVYTLKNKNTLEIAYYIRFFGRHLGVSEIL